MTSLISQKFKSLFVLSDNLSLYLYLNFNKTLRMKFIKKICSHILSILLWLNILLIIMINLVILNGIWISVILTIIFIKLVLILYRVLIGKLLQNWWLSVQIHLICKIIWLLLRLLLLSVSFINILSCNFCRWVLILSIRF